MYEVIEAIDGPICLNFAWLPGRAARGKIRCPAHPVWAKAQRAMLDVLRQASMTAMALDGSARGRQESAGLSVLPTLH